MTDEQILGALASTGVDTKSAMATWTDSLALLSALDAVGRAGGHAIVKIDGARDGELVYTVMVGGGDLADNFFRRDGSDLRLLLREALEFYVAHATLRRGRAGSE